MLRKERVAANAADAHAQRAATMRESKAAIAAERRRVQAQRQSEQQLEQDVAEGEARAQMSAQMRALDDAFEKGQRARADFDAEFRAAVDAPSRSASEGCGGSDGGAHSAEEQSHGAGVGRRIFNRPIFSAAPPAAAPAGAPQKKPSLVDQAALDRRSFEGFRSPSVYNVAFGVLPHRFVQWDDAGRLCATQEFPAELIRPTLVSFTGDGSAPFTLDNDAAVVLAEIGATRASTACGDYGVSVTDSLWSSVGITSIADLHGPSAAVLVRFPCTVGPVIPGHPQGLCSISPLAPGMAIIVDPTRPADMGLPLRTLDLSAARSSRCDALRLIGGRLQSLSKLEAKRLKAVQIMFTAPDENGNGVFLYLVGVHPLIPTPTPTAPMRAAQLNHFFTGCAAPGITAVGSEFAKGDAQRDGSDGESDEDNDASSGAGSGSPPSFWCDSAASADHHVANDWEWRQLGDPLAAVKPGSFCYKDNLGGSGLSPRRYLQCLNQLADANETLSLPQAQLLGLLVHAAGTSMPIPLQECLEYWDFFPFGAAAIIQGLVAGDDAAAALEEKLYDGWYPGEDREHRAAWTARARAWAAAAESPAGPPEGVFEPEYSVDHDLFIATVSGNVKSRALKYLSSLPLNEVCDEFAHSCYILSPGTFVANFSVSDTCHDKLPDAAKLKDARYVALGDPNQSFAGNSSCHITVAVAPGAREDGDEVPDSAISEVVRRAALEAVSDCANMRLGGYKIASGALQSETKAQFALGVTDARGYVTLNLAAFDSAHEEPPRMHIGNISMFVVFLSRRLYRALVEVPTPNLPATSKFRVIIGAYGMKVDCSGASSSATLEGALDAAFVPVERTRLPQFESLETGPPSAPTRASIRQYLTLVAPFARFAARLGEAPVDAWAGIGVGVELPTKDMAPGFVFHDGYLPKEVFRIFGAGDMGRLTRSGNFCASTLQLRTDCRAVEQERDGDDAPVENDAPAGALPVKAMCYLKSNHKSGSTTSGGSKAYDKGAPMTPTRRVQLVHDYAVGRLLNTLRVSRSLESHAARVELCVKIDPRASDAFIGATLRASVTHFLTRCLRLVAYYPIDALLWGGVTTMARAVRLDALTHARSKCGDNVLRGKRGARFGGYSAAALEAATVRYVYKFADTREGSPQWELRGDAETVWRRVCAAAGADERRALGNVISEGLMRGPSGSGPFASVVCDAQQGVGVDLYALHALSGAADDACLQMLRFAFLSSDVVQEVARDPRGSLHRADALFREELRRLELHQTIERAKRKARRSAAAEKKKAMRQTKSKQPRSGGAGQAAKNKTAAAAAAGAKKKRKRRQGDDSSSNDEGAGSSDESDGSGSDGGSDGGSDKDGSEDESDDAGDDEAVEEASVSFDDAVATMLGKTVNVQYGVYQDQRGLSNWTGSCRAVIYKPATAEGAAPEPQRLATVPSLDAAQVEVHGDLCDGMGEPIAGVALLIQWESRRDFEWVPVAWCSVLAALDGGMVRRSQVPQRKG